VPFSLGSLIASASSARLAPRLGRSILRLGAGILCLAVILTIATVRLAGVDLKGYELIPALFIGGIGLGFIIAPLLNVVLAGVPVRSAGSASGLYTTTQQLGNALGIAIIGVVLFGQLGSNADSASAKVQADMNRQLTAAGVPPQFLDRIDQAFAVCFHDRANAKDPTATPESCKRAQRTRILTGPTAATVGPRIGRIFQGAGVAALKEDFVSSTQAALLFDLGAWALAFLLVPLLPKVSTLSRAAPAAG
jgi:hypothetical protein